MTMHGGHLTDLKNIGKHRNEGRKESLEIVSHDKL